MGDTFLSILIQVVQIKKKLSYILYKNDKNTVYTFQLKFYECNVILFRVFLRKSKKLISREQGEVGTFFEIE